MTEHQSQGEPIVRTRISLQDILNSTDEQVPVSASSGWSGDSRGYEHWTTGFQPVYIIPREKREEIQVPNQREFKRMLSASSGGVSCPVCSYGNFMKLSRLVNHMEIHKRVRKYSCSQCDKSFGRRHDLARHETGHLNVREFVCDLCQMTFNRKVLALPLCLTVGHFTEAQEKQAFGRSRDS